jgi:hypothetical protein
VQLAEKANLHVHDSMASPLFLARGPLHAHPDIIYRKLWTSNVGAILVGENHRRKAKSNAAMLLLLVCVILSTSADQCTQSIHAHIALCSKKLVHYSAALLNSCT